LLQRPGRGVNRRTAVSLRAHVGIAGAVQRTTLCPINILKGQAEVCSGAALRVVLTLLTQASGFDALGRSWITHLAIRTLDSEARVEALEVIGHALRDVISDSRANRTNRTDRIVSGAVPSAECASVGEIETEVSGGPTLIVGLALGTDHVLGGQLSSVWPVRRRIGDATVGVFGRVGVFANVRRDVGAVSERVANVCIVRWVFSAAGDGESTSRQDE
jgi:hypothetical protein